MLFIYCIGKFSFEPHFAFNPSCFSKQYLVVNLDIGSLSTPLVSMVLISQIILNSFAEKACLAVSVIPVLGILLISTNHVARMKV